MTEQPGWSDPGQAPYHQPQQGQLVPYQQGYGQQPYGQPYGHAYAQQGYGQAYAQYVYPPSPPTNTLAIVALVLAVTVAPGGLICGIIARRQIRQTGEGGDGLALAGIIVGAISTALTVLPFVIWLVVVISSLILLGAGA